MLKSGQIRISRNFLEACVQKMTAHAYFANLTYTLTFFIIKPLRLKRPLKIYKVQCHFLNGKMFLILVVQGVVYNDRYYSINIYVCMYINPIYLHNP
jgi:hypothetical protein